MKFDFFFVLRKSIFLMKIVFFSNAESTKDLGIHLMKKSDFRKKNRFSNFVPQIEQSSQIDFFLPKSIFVSIADGPTPLFLLTKKIDKIDFENRMKSMAKPCRHSQTLRILAPEGMARGGKG